MRLRILLGAFVVAALVCAWWFDSTTCPVALLFGVPCPGCGLGRATLALVTGHPVEAFRLYPLVGVALPALLVFVTFPPARAARSHVGLVTFPPARFSHSRPPAPTVILPGGNPPDPPRRLAGPRRGLASLAFETRRMQTIAAAALLIAVFGVWIARFAGAFGGPVPVRSAWTVTR